MGRPPSFDRDRLVDLLRSGDYTSHTGLAEALSTPERTVAANAVAVAVWRLRKLPEFADLPAFGVEHGTGLVAQLERNTGRKVHPDCRMHNLIERLRQVDRLRRGLPVSPKADEDLAIRFEEDLRGKRYVIDLDNEGRPYMRPADVADEVDNTGNIREIIAQHPLPPVGGQ